MKITCKQPCPFCGQPSFFDVDDALGVRVVAWMNDPRPLIQEALPDLTADQREQLMTGSHGPCFDAAFADEEP